MFKLRKDQYNLFKEEKIDQFIFIQIHNLREKQTEALVKYKGLELEKTVRNIVNWALEYDISKLVNLEYLVNLYFKYQLTEKYINTNEDIKEIVTYPDRDENDKISMIHHLLMCGAVYGD